MRIIKIYFFLLFILFSFKGYGTHIVGGEMTYTCLGDDNYEIQLTIFRDCFNGNPNAWFDNPASIGVFDENNILLQNILIEWESELNDTLEPILSDSCFIAPPSVCVHTTTYTTLVNLPPIQGGYQLAYQRCCRNVTIANLIEPLDVGATFGVTISETALEECNSNPKFSVWPPLYICVNEPINFDQSAFDIDGDSIVYKLCTPLNGATPDAPIPQPPNPPPYMEVPWFDPPYNVNNMLNGSPGGTPLTIDSQTGLLTGVPNTIGQFVVGICVEEYRNEELISTTRRDFQYNVGVCGVATSAFFIPEVQCTGLTVEFDNLSLSANDYIWYFNDPDNPGATSTEINPTYTYPDTGEYTIMLIAEPGTSCVDTTYETIHLLEDSLIPSFSYEIVECSDSVVIQATDMSVDSLSDPVSWEWVLQTIDGTFTSNEQNPSFVIYNSTAALLTLTVTAENGCQKEFLNPITIELLEDELLADSIFICAGDSINLNPGDPIPNATYIWSPSATLDDPNSPNPLATPLSTTTYSVSISDNSGCEIERFITVQLPEPLIADAGQDIVTCETDVLLSAGTNYGNQFFWAHDAEFDDLFSVDQEVTVTPFGESTYYLLIRDSLGCAAYDSVTIVGNGINILLEPEFIICEGDTIEIGVGNLDPTDQLTFSWSPIEDILEGAQSNSPTIYPNEVGVNVYTVEISNQFDCELIESVEIGVVDTTAQLGFVAFQQCAGFTVQFENTSVNAPFYIWDFGDPNNNNDTSTESNPTYTYQTPGVYTVILSLPPDVPCPEVIEKEIIVEEPQINVDFNWDFSGCTDSVLVSFQDLSTNLQSSIESWEWYFSDGQNSQEQNPAISIDQSQNLEVLLVINSSDGCRDSLLQDIDIQLIETSIEDTITICIGESIGLNPNPNLNYEYEWEPSNTLNNPNSPNPIASPVETTTYSVTITDYSFDTCQIVRNVTAIVPPEIDLMLPTDTVICSDEVSIMAESNNAVSFEWYLDEGLDFQIGFSNTLNSFVTGDQNFYLVVEDDFGCQRIEEVLVSNRSLSISLPDSIELCIGDTAQIELLNLNPTDGSEYLWSPSDGIISGQNTELLTVSPSNSINYTVDITNDFGCTLSQDVWVAVNDFIPTLEIIPNIDTIFLGDSIQLNATFDPFYQYFWSPTNTLSFSEFIFNPFANPEETTEYTLTIRDSEGCVNTRGTIIVVLQPECTDPFIFVPTGFTPNNDGVNDFFEVFGNSIDQMELVVYNRWGQKVFESRNQNDKWDGTFEGKALPPDVFGFYLSVRCFSGAQYVKKGNVTLIR